MRQKLSLLFCAIVLFFGTNVQAQTTDSLSAENADNITLVNKVVNWYMDNLNYGTITLLMTVESSFIPFPSEVVIPPAAYAACNPENESLYVTDNNFLNVTFVVLFSTLGAILGALINYFLSFFLGRPIVYWFADSKLGHLFLLNSEKVKKAEDYFVAHGNISTLIGRLVPGIRQLISIPAGLAKMKLPPFLLFTALGAGAWNIILAVVGYIAHGQRDIIDKYSHELSIILLGLGILFVIYLVISAISKRNKKKKITSESDTQ